MTAAIFKRRIINAVGLIALVGVFYFGFMGMVYPHLPWPIDPSTNPDPNHTHADFAVWIGGTKLDFTDARYMSTPPPTDTTSLLGIPIAHAHEELYEGVVAGREHLHLHDRIGHVVHRHKPGLTIGDFFTSLGLTLSDECFTLDDFLYAQLDDGWKTDFAITNNVCNNGKFHWSMYVNGEARPMDHHYVFQDNDKILFTYDAGDDHTALLEQMTDDACLYSKICPWRGDPPAENCIADPEIPCAAPLEAF